MLFLISLISSTPLLLAASISTISISLLELLRQTSHSLHKSPFIGLMQLTAFAKILAILVFPTPLGPAKIYACAILSSKILFLRIFTTISCPTTSSNFLVDIFYITICMPFLPPNIL